VIYISTSVWINKTDTSGDVQKTLLKVIKLLLAIILICLRKLGRDEARRVKLTRFFRAVASYQPADKHDEDIRQGLHVPSLLSAINKYQEKCVNLVRMK
jgi:hypothetical protein